MLSQLFLSRYTYVWALNDNKVVLAGASLFPLRVFSGSLKMPHSHVPSLRKVYFLELLWHTVLGSSLLQASNLLNKNEVGICISPLIQLAQPEQVQIHKSVDRLASRLAMEMEEGRLCARLPCKAWLQICVAGTL